MTRPDSLLASAKDFLVEALDNYRQKKLSFAILHAVTAAELVMKERLARIHPHLIYRSIDAKNLRDEQTVGLNSLPVRLTNLGVGIQPREATLVRTIARWRNEIVHHMPSFDPTEAERQLPRLLDFIARFLSRHLDVSLKSFLPQRLYSTVNGLINEWKKEVRVAEVKAKRAGGVLDSPCPNCGAVRVLTSGDDKRVICHLCDVPGYQYDTCTECGCETPIQISQLDNGNVCDECIDAAGDRYVSMLVDRELGK